MLNFESVKQRLERESPLTFLEFNYMLLQAYDFVELNKCAGVLGCWVILEVTLEPIFCFQFGAIGCHPF